MTLRMMGLLLLLCPSVVRGTHLSPCGRDNVEEIMVGKETHFICAAEKPVQWTLRLNSLPTGKTVISVCDKECRQMSALGELFIGRTIDARSSSMIIKPVNNTLYNSPQLLNGSLECSLRDEDNMSAHCGLSYVDPPKDVSCTATNYSWSVNVSCSIGSVYSSRKSYKCHLIRLKDMSKNVTLDVVTMETSPTSEKITQSEVKMSGYCQFNTTLPAEEGHYSFYVSFTPRGQHVASYKPFTVERPWPPTVSCDPQTYVLENTNVTCTCNTTSLGQPAGFLRWTTGNQTIERRLVKEYRKAVKSTYISYSQTLTLSDHDRTWLRCDVIWGTSEVRGENYTARVGHAAKTPRLFPNGVTAVVEGRQVHLSCESEGRPTPNVTINNNDNNTVIKTDSSPVNHTFIARCEDMATYTCIARNEFSRHVTTSLSLKLEVGCKPRSQVTTDIGKITFRNGSEELDFNVIASPVPRDYVVWFVGVTPNSSDHFPERVDGSSMNVTCQAYTDRRYLAKCTLTVFSVYYGSGYYKVQVINEHGDENFTVEIIYNPAKLTQKTSSESGQKIVAILAGTAAGFTFVITIMIFSVVNYKKNKRKDSSTFQPVSSSSLRSLHRSRRDSEGDQPSQDPEDIYQIPWDSVPLTMQPSRVNITAGASRPEPCQIPVYAVVDKTKKKTNTQPSHFAKTKDDMVEARRDGSKGSKFTNLGVWQDADTDADYVVLDKSRGRAPARQDKHYNNMNKPSPNTSKGFVDNEDDGNDYDHLVMQQLPARRDVAARREASTCASNFHSEDDGKWVNDDGLIYVTPFFDVAAGVKPRPPPIQEDTEYCSIQTISIKKN